jgi:hypothetical protein
MNISRVAGVRRTLVVCVLVLSCTGTVPAGADEATGLRKCRSITDAQARLACYDAIPIEGTGSVAPAGQPGPVTAEPPSLSERRAPNAQMTPEQFGSERLPAPTVAPGGPPVQTLDTITAAIESYTIYRDGHFAVTLSNGQVWEQLRGDLSRAYFKRSGDNTVEISRGLVGGYNLVLNRSSTLYRVTRLK